ncbi:ankyrin repeat-containing domain protein, partial [Lactarius deliciosus]
LLLNQGAKVGAVDVSGKTPLHEVSQGVYASEDAGIGVARLLLEYGADVNTKTKSGETPIDAACHCQRFKLAELLLENVTSVHAETMGELG